MSAHKKPKTYYFLKEWEIDFFFDNAERRVHIFDICQITMPR